MRRLLRALAMLRDDRGSTIPLVIGYVVVALAVIVVTVDATSLYIAQKRLDAVADAAVLAAADGFEIRVEAGTPRAVLVDDRVYEQAEALVADSAVGARLVSAESPDGHSARVTVATTWHPPLVSALVPGGVDLGSTATGRTALR